MTIPYSHLLMALLLVSLEAVQVSSRQLQQACEKDSDCVAQFCSEGVCRDFGTCASLLDCQNPSNVYPTVECEGYLQCNNSGQCGIQCSDRACPNNDIAFCSQLPCEATVCDESYVSCVDDFCGDCSAIYINAAGQQVCPDAPLAPPTAPSPPTTAPEPSPVAPPTSAPVAPPTASPVAPPTTTAPVTVTLEGSCSSSDECTDQYCSSAGQCREMGSCGNLVDCQNPDNIYATIACAGALLCQEGQCGVECDIEVPDEDSCESNSDCDRSSQFCSEGTCRDYGTCSSLLDCQNPANIYQSTNCEGFLKCDKGQCGTECSDRACPTADIAFCFAAPCDTTECDEPYAACVDDYCGGDCSAIFINDGGYQVCTTKGTTQSCNSDRECTGDNQYCGSGVCQEMGTCSSLLDCRNPSNTYPMVECVGFLECDQGQCRVECSGSFCPNNDEVQCDPLPCEVETCDESYVDCVNDECGGCTATFLSASGKAVCVKPEAEPMLAPTTEPASEPTPELAPTPAEPQVEIAASCENDQDCSTTEFCASGECLAFGRCSSALDCQNPSNSFPSVACVGFLQCQEGECWTQCEGSFCPNNDQVVCDVEPCSDPALQTCEESYEHCVNNECGGCNAIFINATGHQVCTEQSSVVVEPEPDPASTSCSSDADCAEGSQFCSAGECRYLGTCGSLIDCQNPSNIFPTVNCVGYLWCENAQCGIKCDESFCPNNDQVECDVEPCSDPALQTCNESYEHCVNDQCGGCKAIFINATGHQVCTESVVDVEPVNTDSCNSNEDCDTTSQFCSAGECRELGSCGSLLDCQNPNNMYPSVLCVGFLQCEEGQCGTECSGSFCPNNDEVDCPDSPCNVTACEEPYEHCVNDNCGGCNAIFINATGHQVCTNDASVVTIGCKSNSDCDVDEVCGGGECLPIEPAVADDKPNNSSDTVQDDPVSDKIEDDSTSDAFSKTWFLPGALLVWSMTLWFLH